MRLSVRGDAAPVLVEGRRAAEVALAEFQAAADGMCVRVLEAGDEQLSLQVHHFGGRADELAYLVVAHGDDPLAAYGHGGRARPGGGEGVDRAAGEDEIGGGGVGHGT
ncbi:hypothetical protein GCM10009646_43100 [Streptomyces aureus]